MKALVWGENRERIWNTVNSIRDIDEDIDIIIGTSDPYQSENRIIETFASFAKVKFENGYRGKLDFIKAHKDDPFLFAIGGVLINETIRENLVQLEGHIAFMNIKIDDGRYISKCNPVTGSFIEPTKNPTEIENEGQVLICFISGGKIKCPEFFMGGFGEGVTLSTINNSKITDSYVRYIGNLDTQITQAGFWVLTMGLSLTGKFLEHKSELENIVDSKISERVFKKVEFDINRLP